MQGPRAWRHLRGAGVPLAPPVDMPAPAAASTRQEARVAPCNACSLHAVAHSKQIRDKLLFAYHTVTFVSSVLMPMLASKIWIVFTNVNVKRCQCPIYIDSCALTTQKPVVKVKVHCMLVKYCNFLTPDKPMPMTLPDSVTSV